ncbi:hypothetical protein BDZ89DRAFT_1004099 [Hymenopellis radicata]|nr:hypothetical protein BDZ89DRAFT_1004099 [Hymenopellis radicata]
MPSLFNTLRLCFYSATLVFTTICFGMALRFITALASSDLTRFVPFAITICCATFFIIVALLLFSFCLRERNPIDTRWELGCLGLAGLLWLVLGLYLATSESKDASVECYASDATATVLDDELASFHTDQFQAMYRVLTAFALLNAILLLGCFFALLMLALKRHRHGDSHMWYGPVTSCAWFNNYGMKSQSRKQAPVLPTRAPRQAKQPTMKEVRIEADLTPVPPRRERSKKQRDYGEVPQRQHSSKSQAQPQRDASYRAARNNSRTRHFSGSSLIGSTTDEYDTGMMANPNRAPR